MRATRRSILKTSVATGIVSSLAGCAGGGGDNVDGSTANIAIAPDGMLGVVFDYIMNQTSVLESYMQDAGYSAVVQESWEDAPLFASGGQDFSTMSSLEAAQLATARDMEIAVFGKIHPMYMGWWVTVGGPYDPESTGGLKQSVDKIVEEQALLGIGAWNGGHIPTEALIMREVFGYDFGEGGDFNIITADYNAIPTLMVDGDLDVGATSPEHGGARFLTDDPQIKPLFHGVDYAKQSGLGAPMLNSLVTSKSYADENPDALDALVRALEYGFDWFLNDPIGIATGSEEYVSMLSALNPAQAEYIIRWGVLREYDFETGMIFEDGIRMDEEFIQEDRTFMQNATEVGFLESGWENRLSWVNI